MARIKQRVKLPSGEEIWCTGESVGNLIENLLSRLQAVSSIPSKKEAPTLQSFVDTVYRPTYIDGLADTTKANYEIYLKLYILPFMGHMPMNEIMVDTLQRFYNWMAHGRSHNLNRKTIDRVGGLLSRTRSKRGATISPSIFPILSAMTADTSANISWIVALSAAVKIWTMPPASSGISR